MVDNLFSLANKSLIDNLEVTTSQRIVTDCWIIIDDHKFDAMDVYETLLETCNGSAYITDPVMVKALKSLHIINHGGNGNWLMSAEKGSNYEYFMAWLEGKIHGCG